MRRLWKILLGLAAALAVLIALNTVSVNNDTKPAKLTVAGARILHLPDGDIQAKVEGPADAPPIVLVHCWSCSMRWWDKLAPLLAKDHRVIRMDLLGHGGSQKPSNGYSMQTQAQIVAETMSAFGVPHAVVVGHSMGSAVVTALAQQSPKLVDGVVLMDMGPNSSYSSTPFDEKASMTPVLGQLGWRFTPRFAVRHGQSKAFAKGVDFPQSFTDDLRGMTYTAYKDAFDEEEAFGNDQALDERLKPLGLPLLVIYGAEDRLQKVYGADAYKDVPGAQIHIVQDAGHSPAFERPGPTAQLIENFTEPIDANFHRDQAAAKALANSAARKKAAAAKQKAAAAKARAKKQAQAVARRAKRKAQ